jgi:hypothetical protein
LGLGHQADDRVASVSQREGGEWQRPCTEEPMGDGVYFADEMDAEGITLDTVREALATADQQTA